MKPLLMVKVSILLGVGLLAFFWRLGALEFLGDEGMYAAIARDMVSSGDWITPRFDGIRYLEKPPLWFWLTALTFSIFGPSEFIARLWAALSAVGLVLLTFLLGRRLVNEQVGFFSGLILVSSFILFPFARIAIMDMLFSFLIALAFYGFVLCAEQADRPPHGSLIFYLGTGLAVLTKGLIGVLFPVLIVGLFILVTGAHGLIRRMRPLVGIPLLLLLTVPWYLAAAVRNEGFLWWYIMDNHLMRFLNKRIVPEDDIPASTVGLLAATALWFFPWSLLLPPAVMDLPQRVHGVRNKEAKERLWWLVPLWIAVIVGSFAASRFKLEYYILPAFPALALLVGRLWISDAKMAEPRQGLRTITPWLGLSFFGAFLFLLALLAWKGAFTTERALAGLSGLNVYFRLLLKLGIEISSDFGPAFFSILARGATFAVVGFGTAWLLSRFRRPHAAFGALVGTGLAIGLLILPFFRLLKPYYSAKAVSLAIQDKAGLKDLIVHEGALGGSGSGLPFYTGRQIHIVNGQYGTMGFGSSYPEVQHLFLDTARFVRLWEGRSRVFLVTNLPLERSVRRFLKSGTVHELGRHGSRWLFSNRES